MKKDVKFISDLMKDYKAERIKNLLKKIWISEFHRFCMTRLGGTSQLFMNDLLKFESDCMTLQIIYNSIGNSQLSGANTKYTERAKYINKYFTKRNLPSYLMNDIKKWFRDNSEKLKEVKIDEMEL